DRFAMLAAGPRTAPERQRALRATIDWSYGLLTVEEQAVLSRLSVFGGSWTIDAAASVVADARVTKESILTRLTALVDKSLVAVDSTADTARYRLLESTRLYALEKLGNDETLYRRRHAEWVAECFRQAEQAWPKTPSEAWLKTYGPELDNLRAALEWA